MADCIFCKLANGEIPTATLYEDDDFRVILDAGPATEGHCLILPKAHYPNLYEMPEELLGKAHILAKHIAEQLRASLGCDGLNIVQNNGSCAGQTVFHFHIHLIPRYEGETKTVIGWTPGELSSEQASAITAKFLSKAYQPFGCGTVKEKTR